MFASDGDNFQNLFEKAREATQSKQLAPNYTVGLKTAQQLVQARYEAPSKTAKSPLLKNLSDDLTSRFRNFPRQ